MRTRGGGEEEKLPAHLEDPQSPLPTICLDRPDCHAVFLLISGRVEDAMRSWNAGEER